MHAVPAAGYGGAGDESGDGVKVLIVKTSSMGDLIHTLPALTDAQRAIPGITFDWVAEKPFAEIPTWHPAVSDVIQSNIRAWKKRPLASWFSRDYIAYRRELSRRDYDLVIDAQGLLKSAWLVARLAHGEVHGYDKNSAREPIAAYTYNHRYAVARDQHAVERTRQLFAQTLGYAVTGEADAGIASTAAANKSIWLVHGTSRSDKEWPEAQWRQLAQALDSKGYALNIPAGSSAEEARAQRIASGLDATVWTGCSLTDIKQAMAEAHAVVAVDTGLAHLADALQRPLVMLFGPTDPGLVGPKARTSQHLSAPAIDDIDVSQVLEALDV